MKDLTDSEKISLIRMACQKMVGSRWGDFLGVCWIKASQESTTGYVYQRAVWAILDELKKEKTYRRHHMSNYKESFLQPEPIPAVRDLHNILNEVELTSREREVLYRHLQSWNTKEIASVMKLSKARISQILKIIRNKVQCYISKNSE